jgi:putative ABC transport system substrate-binding protein
MQRREFITLLGSAAATWPLAARAQQSEPMRRIGVLMNLAADDAEGQARLAAFTQVLKQLGWSEGRNLRIDTRWATADDIRRHAAELAALHERKMAGAAQRDRAQCDTSGGPSGSRHSLRDRAVRR